MLNVLRTTRRALAAGAAAAALAAGTALPAAPTAAAAPRAIVGSVFTWGANGAGQLGDGTTVDRTDPAPAALPAGTRQVTMGAGFAAALNADGTVSAWGLNDHGQLGDNTTTSRPTPVPVKTPSGMTFSQIAAGESDMLALRTDGTVWAWGGNSLGQLGDRTTTDSSVPMQVPDLTGVTQIAAGGLSGYALRSDGTVWAWGDNRFGELGDGTTLTSLVPERVAGLAGSRVTKVAAGLGDAFAVLQAGTVDAWGRNDLGQLGDGTTSEQHTPETVLDLSGVTQISTSGFHTLAIAGASGQVWAWGDNRDGEVGDGSRTERHKAAPIALSGITQVYAGELASAAISSTGTLLSWGINDHGDLGYDTSDADQLLPRTVTALAGVSEAQISQANAVVIGQFPPVEVPDLTDLGRSSASAQLQAVGLVLGPVRTLVDPTCTDLNKVISQDPGPGSLVSRGTAIAIWLGVRPQSGCRGG